jgi:hypothetical protein
MSAAATLPGLAEAVTDFFDVCQNRYFAASVMTG